MRNSKRRIQSAERLQADAAVSAKRLRSEAAASRERILDRCDRGKVHQAVEASLALGLTVADLAMLAAGVLSIAAHGTPADARNTLMLGVCTIANEMANDPDPETAPIPLAAPVEDQDILQS